MRKTFFFIVFVNSFFYLCAQSSTLYNIQGDQALIKKDYQTACIWYNEGLDSCDQYSIMKLVDVWKDQQSMRESMQRSMRKCFSCMETIVEFGDPDMIRLYSEFYKFGIGTPIDTTLSNYWNEEWKKSVITMVGGMPEIINTSSDSTIIKTHKKSLLSNLFYSFVTYTYSPTMPFGFTAGIYDKFGGYVSFRTDFNPVDAAFECNNTKVPTIDIENPLYEFNRERWYSRMITGGVMYSIYKKRLFVSVGGGYGKRDYYREIVSTTNQNFSTRSRNAWCYNTEASYEGWTIEAGGMFEWKKLAVTGGVNSTKFKDLDIYIGLGITF
jgi:hypothetical protein